VITCPHALRLCEATGGDMPAATVALVYPLLRRTYGIGGDNGLQSPISQRFAGLARILSEGVKALPTGALQALLVGVAVGVLLTFLESNPRWRKWVPSPTGIGIGMLVPGSAVCAMFVGASLGELWRMAKSRNYTLHAIPLASGLIAGEALIATLIPIAVAARIVPLQD